MNLPVSFDILSLRSVGVSASALAASLPLDGRTKPSATFIYALLEPCGLPEDSVLRTEDERRIRYIGKSDDPKSRLVMHVWLSKRQRNHRANWIRSLGNRIPVLKIVDEVSMAEWQAIEAAYIDYFESEGCCLVNHSRGGEGLGSGKDHPLFGTRRTVSEETRAKLRAAFKRLSPEHLAKFRAAALARRGIKLSQEQRARLSAAKKGIKRTVPISPETRAKLRAAKLGKKRGPMPSEWRDKLRLAKSGKPMSEDTKRKIGQANSGMRSYWFGRTKSSEHRAKLSATMKGNRNSCSNLTMNDETSH